MRFGPLGWALVIVTALFALTSALAFLITGEFSEGWLYASTAVYATIIIVAVALLITDMRRPRATATTNGDEALLTRRLLIYHTREGSAWRLEYAWPDGRAESRYLAAAGGQMLTHQEIVGYVDALPPSRGASLAERDLDAAIAKHALLGPDPDTPEIPR